MAHCGVFFATSFPQVHEDDESRQSTIVDKSTCHGDVGQHAPLHSLASWRGLRDLVMISVRARWTLMHFIRLEMFNGPARLGEWFKATLAKLLLIQWAMDQGDARAVQN